MKCDIYKKILDLIWGYHQVCNQAVYLREFPKTALRMKKNPLIWWGKKKGQLWKHILLNETEANTVQGQKKEVSHHISEVLSNFMVFPKKSREKVLWNVTWRFFLWQKQHYQDCCLALLHTYTWNASSYMLSALEMEAAGGSKYQRWIARERFQSNWEQTLICFCSESCHTCR